MNRINAQIIPKQGVESALQQVEKAKRSRWYQPRDRRPEVYGELSRMI